MSELIVYSYGMGEFVSSVFNAVASTINGSDGGFLNALKVAFLISFTISVYKYILTKSIPDLAKNIFLYIGVTGILIMPYPKNLIIQDDVSGYKNSISNVPIGLAYPAALVSTGFYELTRLVETNFHHIDDLSYTKSGFLFASHVVRNAAQVKITDPDLNQSIKSFISNCVFYDVYLGAYTFKDLLTTDDTWGLITKRASGNRAFEMDGKVTICKKGVEELNKKLVPEIDNSILKYAKYILPSYRGTESEIKSKVISGVSNGYSYLTKKSQDATAILRQNILINAINDAALDNPESGMYSYAVTRANTQKSISNVSTGIMMARWLPAMQGAMEAMMYAMFILVALYALFINGEKVIGNYIITLTWLSSWPVIYAVMNFGFTWVIAMRSSGLGHSFYDSSALSQIQADMSSLFGYFSLSVPYFAWGLINLGKQGLGSVFTQMAQLVGSSTQSLAMSASGEAVTGNYSFGNTSFDNQSMYNTSGFKHDTNASFAAGSTTSMLMSGSTITTTADGSSVLNMESGMSRLNTGINFQDRVSSSITNQADTALNLAKSNQISWAENMSSVMRQLGDMGSSINSSTNSGDSYSLSSSSGLQKSITDYASAIDKFAHDNGMSKQDAGRYLAGAYINTSAHMEFGTDKQLIGKVVEMATGTSGGVRVSGGIKGEADRSWTTTDSENFHKAQEFIKQNNLTETIDKAIRGVEENRYQTDFRTGSQINESIAASIDKAKQASSNFTKNYQESLSYRDIASTTKDNASSINFNANQDFIEYLSKQPIGNSKDPMGERQAEAVLKSDPKLRDLYANDFVKQETANYINRFKQDHNIKSNIIKDSKLSDEYKSLQSKVSENYQSNNRQVMGTNEALALKNTYADESVKTKVVSNIHNDGLLIDNAFSSHETKAQDFNKQISNKVKNTQDTDKIVDLAEEI